MYLLAKFGDYSFYTNGNINSFINPYMDTLKKVNSAPGFTILQDF